nr:MmgE/PrpD family protein [Nitratireductor luteus]
MEQIGLVGELARHRAGIRFEDIPDPIRHEAKRALLNFLATSISGANDPTMAVFAASLSGTAGSRKATVIGRALKSDHLSAAFLNAASANVADFDDTHLPTIIHPTAPVAPALFALAERGKLTGRQWITAFAVGVDIECRIGLALAAAHYQRGWHITATCGVFGAAAAAAHALGSPNDVFAHALACAATQSGGLVEAIGTGSKSLGIGNACRNGLWSAELAARGLTGPATALEGTHGLFAVMGSPDSAGVLLEGLGDNWELGNNTYKPYPCGVVINPVVDACLELRTRLSGGAEGITRVVVRGNSLLLKRADRPRLAQQRDAQVSLQHAAATALLHGIPTPRHFTEPFLSNSQMAGLRERISVAEDPSLEVDQAEVELILADGRSWTQRTEEASGGLKNPLSDGALTQKYHMLADECIGRARAEELAATVWSLEDLDDVASLLGLTLPVGTAG